MNELLHNSGSAIAIWLEAKLPALSSNWWKENVVNRLTFQQQRLVEEKRVQSLAGLDLAAVLRVLDQNWSELAGGEPLPREARNWVKELQSVRNRWAHAPAGGLSPTDTFRDADTLGRLLKVVGAGADPGGSRRARREGPDDGGQPPAAPRAAGGRSGSPGGGAAGGCHPGTQDPGYSGDGQRACDPLRPASGDLGAPFRGGGRGGKE